MKISFHFLWYDFWVGWFWDQKKQILYVNPLPCCVFKIVFKEKRTVVCLKCGEIKRYEVIPSLRPSPREKDEKVFFHTRCSICGSEQPLCLGGTSCPDGDRLWCSKEEFLDCWTWKKSKREKDFRHPRLSFFYKIFKGKKSI